MRDVLPIAVASIAVLALLGVLWAIVRFASVSPRRLRSSRAFLREPDVSAVEALCGFTLQPEVVTFYRTSPFLEHLDFALIDRSTTPSTIWRIGEFTALTPSAVREWRAVSGVQGVPIASDGEKGMYFLRADGSLALSSPNVPGGSVVVASSITALQRYDPEAPEPESAA